jgi:hypothetical protein
MNTNLTALMAQQHGVFTAVQAARCGVTQKELQREAVRGDVVVVRRAIYTTRAGFEALDDRGLHALDVAAALLARGVIVGLEPGAAEAAPLAAGHTSAAYLWQLPAPKPSRRTAARLEAPRSSRRTDAAEEPPPRNTGTGKDLVRPAPGVERVHRVVELISSNRCQRTYRAGVHVRPAALPAGHISSVGGLPATSVARTVIDLAREGRWYDAVIVADAALHRGIERAELEAVATYCARWRGGLQALRAVAFADGRAESPAESLARTVFAEHGLPTPDLQVNLGDESGPLGRVDLLYRAQRTIVEVDGMVKYLDPAVDPRLAAWNEKLREDALRDAGWEIVRVTWQQLVSAPLQVVARVRAAFARAARAMR